MCPRDARCVGLAVPSPACDGHALELACLDHPGMAGRAFVGDRSLADVRDDLASIAGATGDVGARREPALVKRLEHSEVIAAIERIEGSPDLPLEASVVVAFGSRVETDHRSTSLLQNPDRVFFE